jgi:hypothetical protein
VLLERYELGAERKDRGPADVPATGLVRTVVAPGVEPEAETMGGREPGAYICETVGPVPCGVMAAVVTAPVPAASGEPPPPLPAVV